MTRSSAPRLIALHRQQTLEECAIFAKRLTEVFRVDVVTTVPLLLQTIPLVGEALGDLLHGLRHQLVGLLHRLTGFVDEARLDVIPTAAQLLPKFAGEQR